MPSNRTIVVIADGSGRHMGRLAIGRLPLLGAMIAAIGLLTAVFGSVFFVWQNTEASTWHRRVVDQNLVMRAKANHCKEVLPDLNDAVMACQVDFAELVRKTGLVAPSQPELLAAHAAPKDGTTGAEALAHAERLQAMLAELLEYHRDAARLLSRTPSIRPARTPWITSSFGIRIDPVNARTLMHKGLDLGGWLGLLIVAPADGTVIFAGPRGGYGRTVVMDHGFGMQTHFAHLSKFLSRPGDVIRRGEPIAEMGSTGKSTGPHVHYEVRHNGIPLDPRPFILD